MSERIRSLLRLELLFHQAQHFLEGSSEWESRTVLSSLMEILAIFGRSDLKTELIKELERNSTTLVRLRDNPGVDQRQLTDILGQLEGLRIDLHGTTGQLGQGLRDNEFLGAIRQRSSIPGGTCDFDLPAYHQWLHRAAERRAADQDGWFATLEPIRRATTLILTLIRNSAKPSAENAPGGIYQRNLDSGVPYHLVRVSLPAEPEYFPEISGGKHRFTIRFMEPNLLGRPRQTSDDVRFQLTCCVL